MKWQHLDPKIETALQNTISPWIGCPYMPGQQCKGIGVDCIRFVTGVLDELYGISRDIKCLPMDVCMHRPAQAVESMLQIMKLYPHTSLKDLSTVEPGDIVITGTADGPGHAMIAGQLDNQLWHTNGRKVVMAAPRFSSRSLSRLFRIVRPANKEGWK